MARHSPLVGRKRQWVHPAPHGLVLMMATRKPPASSPTTQSAPTAPPGQRVYLLDPPFEARALAQAHGAKWYPGIGWAWTGTSLPHALASYAPKRYSWTAFQQQQMWGAHRAPEPPAPDPTTGTFVLRTDQLEDVRRVLEARRDGAPEVLIASDVGVGKTSVAVSAIKRMGNVRNVLVVCPLSVAPGWRLHLDQMGDGGKNWVIINYESTKKLLTPPSKAAKAKRVRTRNLAIVSKGTAKVQWDVIVRDEAHWSANPESQQSRAVEKIIAGPGARSAFVINLSATAGANPAQLSYLHRSLWWSEGSRPLRLITADAYVEWCAQHGLSVKRSGFNDALVWQPEPENRDAELKTMHRLLFTGAHPVGFRRKPDWPRQERFAVPVELTREERSAYEEEWGQFAAAMKALDAARLRPADAAGRRARAAAHARGLAAQLRYRQKAGQLRAAATAAFAAEMVAKGCQVALSAEFLGTVERLREALEALNVSVVTFTGANREDRENERIAYQRGDAQAIIFTTTEGINLHAGEKAIGGNTAPRRTVVAEPRWSPRKALQCEGRSQRDGQAAPVYYTYATDTVEEKVIRTVLAGMQATATINGDDLRQFTGLASALGVPSVLND